MRLVVENLPIDIERGESLLHAVKKLGLDSDTLRERPIAARIGGEIFSLNFRPTAESSVRLLRYRDEMGRRAYERTLLLVLIASVRKLFPGARVMSRYSMGQGLYVTVDKEPMLSKSDVAAIKAECLRLVGSAVPLIRKRLGIKEALAFFEGDGQKDKADLMRWRRFGYFDVYSINGYMDYFYGEMVPDTSYLTAFDIRCLDSGALMLIMPDAENPDTPAEYKWFNNLGKVYRQSDEWGKLMRCSTAVELNRCVESGGIRELIRVNEALHEKTYAYIADRIAERGARAVMLAGPSSSGKTTSANRIATQLRVLGLDPVMLSLDNYYIDRDKIPEDENGEKDLEHINTLDIPKFNSDLEALIEGRETELPVFDFLTGRRAKEGVPLRLYPGQPLIVEGIHGLNPMLISDKIAPDKLFKVYVSALTTLNLDDHNRIKTTDVRLLRRLVRDHATRGASLEKTLSMWSSVRRGEERWIFPNQENADVIFNTTLHYELAVLKKYVYPLLLDIPEESEYYAQARSVVKFLNYFVDADVEDEIPPTSILREFIGGNTFYK